MSMVERSQGIAVLSSSEVAPGTAARDALPEDKLAGVRAVWAIAKDEPAGWQALFGYLVRRADSRSIDLDAELRRAQVSFRAEQKETQASPRRRGRLALGESRPRPKRRTSVSGKGNPKVAAGKQPRSTASVGKGRQAKTRTKILKRGNDRKDG